jgi:hypothetical protein
MSSMSVCIIQACSYEVTNCDHNKRLHCPYNCVASLCFVRLHIKISCTNVATNVLVKWKNGFSALQQVNLRTECGFHAIFQLEGLNYADTALGSASTMEAHFGAASYGSYSDRGMLSTAYLLSLSTHSKPKFIVHGQFGSRDSWAQLADIQPVCCEHANEDTSLLKASISWYQQKIISYVTTYVLWVAIKWLSTAFRNFCTHSFYNFLFYLYNTVFWDVMPCGSCKKRRFRRTYRLKHQGGTT